MTLAVSAPPPTPTQRRAQHAAVARALLAAAPAAARALGWTALTDAPAWLALDDEALALQARRTGAVLAAPALRLWIGQAEVAAARAAVGPAWHAALLARAHWPAWPVDAPVLPAEPGAREALPELLRQAGAAVLLASLPHGALRHAASVRLAPLAPLALPAESARAVLQVAAELA